MSVLIKGMEKPKDCGVCPFELDGWPDEYVEICKLLDRQVGYFGEESEIPSDCPIIDVPTPHGRLIDTADLLKTIAENAYLVEHGHNEIEYGMTCFGIMQAISEAPTIIEAEEADS